jgi:hypothetical protein
MTRAKRALARRAQFFRNRLAAAKTLRGQLAGATEWLHAEAARSPDEEVKESIRVVMAEVRRLQDANTAVDQSRKGAPPQ